MANLTGELAGKIVKQLESVCGYQFIICNTEGIIIADVAGKRVGKSHVGAKQILTTSEIDFTVTHDMEVNTNGASKEGYNRAIFKDGVKVGTLGAPGDTKILIPLLKVSSWWVETQLNLIDANESTQDAVEKTAAATEQLASSAESVRDLTVSIKNEANKIEEVVGFVKNIADQTNMLGINAAIEAAHAGDHGRGFSVVADEIRKMSDKSRQASGEISVFLNDLGRDMVSMTHMATELSSAVNSIATNMQDLQVKVNKPANI